MKGKIVNRDSKLYVLCSDALSSEPKLIYRYWLIERTQRNAYNCDGPEEGDPVTYRGDGYWHVADRLAGGVYTGPGNTEAAYVEEVSAPRPKVRAGIDVRWNDGRWEKLAKKGWVPA